MKLKQLLAASVMMGLVSAASATPGYGVITSGNLSPMTTKALGPTAKVLVMNGNENPCPAGDGLLLGEVGDAFAKESLSIILTARTSNTDVAFGYDDETCVVETVMLVTPAP